MPLQSQTDKIGRQEPAVVNAVDQDLTRGRVSGGTVRVLREDAAMVEWSEFLCEGVDGRHITVCVLA